MLTIWVSTLFNVTSRTVHCCFYAYWLQVTKYFCFDVIVLQVRYSSGGYHRLRLQRNKRLFNAILFILLEVSCQFSATWLEVQRWFYFVLFLGANAHVSVVLSWQSKVIYFVNCNWIKQLNFYSQKKWTSSKLLSSKKLNLELFYPFHPTFWNTTV